MLLKMNNSRNNMNTNSIIKNHKMIESFTLKSTQIFKSKIAVVLFAMSLSLNAWTQCETINLACNDLINVSINEDCYASINADLILEAPPFNIFYDDGFNYKITLQDNKGFPIIPSNQVGEGYVGQTLKATVTLVPCNISCWGYIHVEDKIGPKFWNCLNGSLPDIDVDCDEFSNGFIIPDPLLGGICQALDVLSFEDDTTSLNCVDEFALTISRLWTATDASGNSTQCQQAINIRRFNLKDVVIPNDYIVNIDPDADCNESMDVSPERTGYPTGIYCPNIMYYYTDINYPQCGLQIKILRDWFVIDWCTGESLSDGQIIKIKDEVAPRVLCQLDTLMVPKANYSCVASPILNPLRVMGFDTLGAVTILDTCPENIIVEVGFLIAEEGKEQPLNSPYYTILPDTNGLFQLPEFEGSAWIRYCFKDACGNATQIPDDPLYADSLGYCCYFQIDAKDLTPPTAICEGFTKVPLGAGGISVVLAESFDDHSFDPCDGISHYEVRRESHSCPGYFENGNLGWHESVHFCCEDIGDTITIRLRIFDNAGNFSECLGLVCVSDPVTPVVVCPDDIVELECGDDYKDYDLIGLPTGEDGCDAGIKLGKETFDLSDYDIACGVGVIKRTIEVKNGVGKIIKICYQDIIFDSDNISTKLEPGDFEFPDDVTIDICNSGGSIDPVFTGIPTTNKSFGCANIALTYNDSAPHVQNTFGVCYTILREWQVVDWCNYHPSLPNQHILKATQEIRVTNSAVPEFNCPSDMTVNTSGFECEAEVHLLVNVSSFCPTSFDVSWSIDAFSDGSVDFTGVGNDASGVYPVGEHTITFVGRNFCGGTAASCTYRFTVEGDKPPVPICYAELIWSLGSGQTQVWASDFDLKSQGGCGLDELIFSFVDPTNTDFPQLSHIFSCADLPNGTAADIPIEVFVVDESGRSASCLSTLKLQDTGDICTDISNKPTLGGSIHSEMDEPLEQVMVELQDMSNDEIMTDMTGLTGGFTFEGLQYFAEYELKPQYNKDHLNGVSTLDLVHIQRHILGIKTLDSPYKLIAADVDASGAITAVDLIQLRKLILGVYEELPESRSWTFVPEDHVFLDPLSPWNYPDYITVSNVAESRYEDDFIAMKIGDVNNSVELTNRKNKGDEQVNSLFISTIGGHYNSGELIEIPLLIENSTEVIGLQFTLDFDADQLLFQGIDSGVIDLSQDNFALLNKEEGKITFSYSQIEALQLVEKDILFKVYFESKNNINVEDVIDINSSITSAQSYDANDEIKRIDFIVKSPVQHSENKFQLFQNEPNPFELSTSISFFNPIRQEVKLTVMDANGRLMYKQEKEFDSGMNKFVLDADDLESSGLLLYRLQTASSSITRKMIMVK